MVFPNMEAERVHRDNAENQDNTMGRALDVVLSKRVLRFAILGLGGAFVLWLGRSGVGEKVSDVFFAQFFGAAEREFAHGEGADAHSDKLGDAQAEGLEHEADLAL